MRALRERFPAVPIVADLKIMDGGYLETKLMAKAGATHVVVMARAHEETLKVVVQAGHDYGVKVMGDNLGCPDMVGAARMIEDLGCDYVIHHIGYDERRGIAASGRRAPNPLDQLREVVAAVSVPVQAVGGLTLGADPLVCATSAAAWSTGRRVTGFFIRKEAKKHGLQQWIEGPFIEEGTPVAIVDDVLTSGGSLATAIEKARQAGGVVVAAIVVIDREEGGREAIEAVLDGAPLHALFTANELLNTDS